MDKMLLDALKKEYQAKIAKHQYNIQTYLDNTVGIGEHSDIVATVDIELAGLAEADEKLETLLKYYPE